MKKQKWEEGMMWHWTETGLIWPFDASLWKTKHNKKTINQFVISFGSSNTFTSSDRSVTKDVKSTGVSRLTVARGSPTQAFGLILRDKMNVSVHAV